MKLPLFWLNQYIDVGENPERLAEKLTMSGTKVERVEKNGGDSVLDLEITTNRPDCLGLLGLAREVSALTGRKVKFPKVPAGKPSGRSKDKRSFVVELDDRKGCPRYTARLLEGVTVKPSPENTARCLRLMGSRPVSNAVDATNFVLFETGQPLHAFDFDKIKGGVVIVRRSRKGEKFLALDGNEYTLDEKTLVIADAERVIAIAGVIGGKLTEVDSGTKNILLESAYFDPTLVRHASKKYKISTDSSYRFERGVTPEGVLLASRRCTDLILSWAGGKATGFAAKGPLSKTGTKRVVLRSARVESLLGVRVGPKKIAGILSALGFGARASGADKVLVTVPSFRRDVTQEADLIEEIVRIEGFDRMPVALPVTRHTQRSPRDEKAVGVLELKEYLAAIGFNEIVTYSLLSRKAIEDSCLFPETDPGGGKLIRKIANAVSAEQEYFRPSLLPGMANAVAYNLHRKAGSIKFFEVGNVAQGDAERTMLFLAISGDFEENWRRKSEASFFDLKGVVENLLGHCGVEELRFEEQPSGAVSVSADGRVLGVLSGFSSLVLKHWDIPREVFYAELVLDGLFAPAGRKKRVQVRPVPKFPSVKRDIAFVVDEKIPVMELEVLMKRIAAPYLNEVFLFDQYIGATIAPGKRSLAFSLAYQKEDGTFTDEEIQDIHRRLGKALQDQYQAEIR